jgi:hypothetical protein
MLGLWMCINTPVFYCPILFASMVSSVVYDEAKQKLDFYSNKKVY